MAWLKKDYLASAFVGCECIATVDSFFYGGMIEIYELHEPDNRKAVGAWYPDMAMMVWPISWFWSLEEKEQTFDPPPVPRNRTHRWYGGRLEITRIPMKGLPPIDDGVARRTLSSKKPTRKKLGRR